MTRYTVTIRTKGGSLVQHVIKAEDRASAIMRGEAAHPGSTCTECKPAREWLPTEDDA